jgi:hypothetical protein
LPNTGDDKDCPGKVGGKTACDRPQRIEATGRAADHEPDAAYWMTGAELVHLASGIGHGRLLTTAQIGKTRKGQRRFLFPPML